LNTQFGLADLLRQSVYSRLAGYEDLNDADRLAADPAFRLIGSPKIWDRGAALTSTLHWFETELLTREENLVGLMAVNRDVLAQAERHDGADGVVLDMDSSESPVHGQQEGGAYNGHFESVCYHPLFLFNNEGDCLAAKLRRATSTAPTTGTSCSYQRSIANRRTASTLPFVPTLRSPSQKSMKRWKHATWTMPSASQRTGAWSWRSKISCFARADVRVASPWFGTRASGTRRTAGRGPAESWPKSNTMPASCSRAGGSS
jgi:hypothetical protein